MANTNREQIVYSEPLWIKNGWYLTPKGERLKKEGASEETLSKYRKMKYVKNHNARPIKTIYHIPVIK